MCQAIDTGWRTGWTPALPQAFSGAKEKNFLHKIGVGERQGKGEKQQHLTKERAHTAKK